MSRILIVDDEPRTLLLLKSFLTSSAYDVETAASGPDALNILTEKTIDIIITDLRMSPMDGLTLYKEVSAVKPQLPIILLTAYASVETAIEAMKMGVFDYLTKPFKITEIIDVVKRAEERIHTLQTVKTAIEAPLGAITSAPRADECYAFDSLIASSPVMKRICDMVRKIAPTTATVLINGESGTGKEVIARALHKISPRKDKPWIAVNCAAIPEPLLESEMFGHVKGAFTGATSDKIGFFEASNGGTFFLDEINSLPLVLQGKLLRVLQEREIRRVGGIESLPVDIRIIAASNTNLEKQMIDGTFRADLYYRLAVVEFDIPPLSKRKEDILPLAYHFIQNEMKGQSMPSLSSKFEKAILAYPWPGNVRELENTIRHALAFYPGGNHPLTPDLLPPKILKKIDSLKEELSTGGDVMNQQLDIPLDTSDGETSLKAFLKQKEQTYLKYIIRKNDGDKEEAAKELNVSLATLYRKLGDD